MYHLIKSKNIVRVKKLKKDLVLEFKSGASYLYNNAGTHIKPFLKTLRPDYYFNEFIRNKYDFNIYKIKKVNYGKV